MTDQVPLKGSFISFLSAAIFTGMMFTVPSQSSSQEPQSALAVPNPHYISATRSVVLDAPVDRVWARVGGFCNITEWMNSPEWEDCRYLQGNGGPASVRSIVNEVMVGQTQYSYTYAQPPRLNTPYNMAHSTLAAEERAGRDVVVRGQDDLGVHLLRVEGVGD